MFTAMEVLFQEKEHDLDLFSQVFSLGDLCVFKAIPPSATCPCMPSYQVWSLDFLRLWRWSDDKETTAKSDKNGRRNPACGEYQMVTVMAWGLETGLLAPNRSQDLARSTRPEHSHMVAPLDRKPPKTPGIIAGRVKQLLIRRGFYIPTAQVTGKTV